jgi:hypothetical protein
MQTLATLAMQLHRVSDASARRRRVVIVAGMVTDATCQCSAAKMPVLAGALAMQRQVALGDFAAHLNGEWPRE